MASSSDEDTVATATAVRKHESSSAVRRRGGDEGSHSKADRIGKAQSSTTAHVKGTFSSISLPHFFSDSSNPVGWAVSGAQEFATDSIRLVRRCTKPDGREFKKIAYACALGFLLMGFIGYIVKLVFIPINNIIVGG